MQTDLNKPETEDRSMTLDYTRSLNAVITHKNGRAITFVWIPERGRPKDKGHRPEGRFAMRLVATDGTLHPLAVKTTGHGLFDDPHSFLDIKSPVSMVTASPYSNTAKFNPFTDEVWANIPAHLDPAKNGKEKTTSPRQVKKSDLKSWKVSDGVGRDWTVSLHPVYISHEPLLFCELDVHIDIHFTSGSMSLEKAGKFSKTLEEARQTAQAWNISNNGRACEMVQE